MIKKLLFCLGFLLTTSAAQAQTYAGKAQKIVVAGGGLLTTGGTLTGPLYLKTSPEYVAYGNQTCSTAGGNMCQDWLWSDGVNNSATLGSIWPGTTTYSATTFSSTFTSSKPSAQTLNGGPSFEHLDLAYQSGAPNSIVATGSVCEVLVADGYCSGRNAIALNNNSAAARLVGDEIDVEFQSGTTDSGGSTGLYLNVFNADVTGADIETGAIKNAGVGSWSNGIVLDGIKNAGISANSGSSTMQELIAGQNGTYSTTEIVLGTGLSHGIEFGIGGGGTSPFAYGSATTNNLVFQLGTGSLVIYAENGTTQLFQITQSGGIYVNGTQGVTCSGTPSSSFASVNGIITHC